VSSTRTIFLAGATGAIGRRLTPLLLDAGYVVYGVTRDPAKAATLAAIGVRPVVVDVYDAATLRDAMVEAKPQIVIHQLTDLPPLRADSTSSEALARNARIRIEGTQHLVDGALACGATLIVSQSIGFVYAPGPEPHVESDPLDPARDAVMTLERLTLASPPLAGAVLRFGMLYGPGTWSAEPTGAMPVHVDAAAWATRLAVDRAAIGVFNVGDDCGYASSARARSEQGWAPELRILRAS